jgi:hypothetical protein
MPLPTPFRSVGRYELLEVIGRGGAAVVYLAHQRDLRRLVALKELAPVIPGDTSFAARFVDESRVAGSLNHPNVVTVHEFFQADGVPLIAMEYLPQGSLRPHVGMLTTAQFAGVLEGVLAGLAHGQSLGVVHRDLKPENLLVTADGRVKIADFGVARAYNQAITREVVTVAGTTIGTPAYMAPEQALGQPLTPATDLYSLGVVAWELLSGRVPFADHDTPVAVLYRHVHEPVAPITSVVAGVDPRLARWLERMLAKRPEDRFPDATAAWDQLEDVVLDLLGPRWRREAPLAVTDSGGDEVAPSRVERRRPPPRAPLTEGAPAADPTAAPEPVPAPEPGHELTPAPALVPARGDERPASTPPGAELDTAAAGQDAEVPAALTVAPRRPPAGRNPTIVRLARRHRETSAEGDRPSPSRRRLVLAGLLLAGAIAAVVAVVLASGSSPRHRAAAKPPAAAPASTAVVNRDLLGLLGPLASARTRGLSVLSGAHTPSGQASAAAQIAAAYRSSMVQFARLPAPVRASAPAVEVKPELTQAEQAWSALATAARHADRRAYQRASNEIGSVEQRLRTLTQRL